MTPVLFAALVGAGGIGSALRFVVDGLLRAQWGDRLPWATIAINLSGSLALGLLVGLADGDEIPRDVLLVAGTGLLGGYTTFSTASLETVRLLQAGRRWAAAVNGIVVPTASVLLALTGLLLGRMA